MKTTHTIEVGQDFEFILNKVLNTLSEYSRVLQDKQNYDKAKYILELRTLLEESIYNEDTQ